MTKKFVINGTLALAGIFVFSLAISAAVRAQSSDMTADKLEIIKTRCSNSQFALQQIEKRDAVSRINRGRSYDQMLRQVSAFNSRLAYNKISAPDLLQITANIQTAVDTFRAHYDRYDTDLTDAMKIDCKQKPADYYNLILRARDDRSTVGDDVAEIADLMSQYRTALEGYKDKVE